MDFDLTLYHSAHWHDLRHAFCSRLVMKGVDIRTVMELAGHKSISVTMRYAHLSQRPGLWYLTGS